MRGLLGEGGIQGLHLGQQRFRGRVRLGYRDGFPAVSGSSQGEH
jgi:hypothetical protein